MINFPLASSTWDDKELDAIQNVIDSKMFTMGSAVKQYENDFAKFLAPNML